MRRFYRLALIACMAASSWLAWAHANNSETAPTLIGQELTIEILPQNFQLSQERAQKLGQYGYVEAVVGYAENGLHPQFVKTFDLQKARVVAVENEAARSVEVHTISLEPTHRTFTGLASYYGGRRSAEGVYTAAHRTLPFGTKVRVTHDGHSVIVVVNDRGPFIRGRVIDLDLAAARAIHLTGVGVGRVICQIL